MQTVSENLSDKPKTHVGLKVTFALFAYDAHCVAPEELQFVHLGLGEGNHRVVISNRVVDNQTVRFRLVAQNRRRQIIFTGLIASYFFFLLINF